MQEIFAKGKKPSKKERHAEFVGVLQTEAEKVNLRVSDRIKGCFPDRFFLYNQSGNKIAELECRIDLIAEEWGGFWRFIKPIVFNTQELLYINIGETVFKEHEKTITELREAIEQAYRIRTKVIILKPKRT